MCFGKAITYDAIGNPLTYNGDTYTWEQGRQLAGISGNSKTISYKYNDGGIRTSKTVNGVTTTYHLVGDKVTYETNGSDKIYYTYDGSGNLASMNLNGVEYYYIRNAQRDITGLFDKTGAQVVGYTYDSWGKLISTTGTLAATVGVKNPYRYRGYRYDVETGLYYLQSRYYNSEWGRFVNADALAGQTGDLLGHNMFAYCKDNPITLKDPSGFRPMFTVGEETDAMRYASLETMSRTNMAKTNQTVSSNTVKIGGVTKQIAVGTVVAVADSAVGMKVFNSMQITKNITTTIQFESGGVLTMGGAMTRSWAKPLKGVGKVGILAIATTGLTLASDYQNNNGWDVAKSMGVDLIGLGTAIGTGILIAPIGLALAPELIIVGGISIAISGACYGLKKILGVN